MLVDSDATVWWFIFQNFKAFAVQSVLKWNYSAVKASKCHLLSIDGVTQSAVVVD